MEAITTIKTNKQKDTPNPQVNKKITEQRKCQNTFLSCQESSLEKYRNVTQNFTV